MIFQEQTSRKPDRYPEAQRFIEALWASHWTPNEFNFISDKKQYLFDLDPQEKLLVIRTLSCIGQIEIAVKKFWGSLGDRLRHPVFSDLGFVIASNEVIHNYAYEKLLRIMDLEEEFERNLKEEVILGRVKYLSKYASMDCQLNQREQFIYSLVLFSLFVEHVSLFSQFFIIMHFNRFRNLLKDTAQQVQYTRNEESLHSQAGFWIIRKIREEHPELFNGYLKERILQETEVAWRCEQDVVEWIMGPYDKGNLNQETVKNYIHFRINSGLALAGFDEESPLGPVPKDTEENWMWMEEETKGNVVTDFFHKRPVQYGKGPDMSGIFE